MLPHVHTVIALRQLTHFVFEALDPLGMNGDVVGIDDKAEVGNAFANISDVRLLPVDRQFQVLFHHPFRDLPVSFRLPLIPCKDQDVVGVTYDPYPHALHLLIECVQIDVA